MDKPNKDVAIRKRQAIDSSKRTMFLFVAGAAFVGGIAIVVSYFLIQQIWFHGRVVSEKQKTVETIKSNIKTAAELKDNLRVLDTNEALNSVLSSDDSGALQTVLDALPAEPNADALGSSLQLRFVGAVDGLTLESLSVDRQNEGEAAEDAGSSIGFTMSVSGSADGLKALLERFERSIRVIKLDTLEIQANNDRLMLNITGRAYYEPAQVVELEAKVVKP